MTTCTVCTKWTRTGFFCFFPSNVSVYSDSVTVSRAGCAWWWAAARWWQLLPGRGLRCSVYSWRNPQWQQDKQGESLQSTVQHRHHCNWHYNQSTVWKSTVLIIYGSEELIWIFLHALCPVYIFKTIVLWGFSPPSRQPLVSVHFIVQKSSLYCCPLLNIPWQHMQLQSSAFLDLRLIHIILFKNMPLNCVELTLKHATTQHWKDVSFFLFWHWLLARESRCLWMFFGYFGL